MKTRKVVLSDFAVLYKLWQEAGLSIYPFEEEKARFKSMLKLNPSLCFVLIDKNKIIGSILGAFDGKNASVHRLAIKPVYQKEGYGSLLLKKVEEKVKKLGIKKIVVQVYFKNTKVLDYYKKKHDYKDMDYVINLVKDL